MNCHKTYSKLLVLSREELNLPTNIDLVQHLHSCPFCDTFRDIWLIVDKDIKKGLEFSPPDNYWNEFSHQFDSKVDVKGRSIFRSILWKLDWLFYPEKSLKWAGAFILIIGMSIGGIKLQQLQSQTIPGLPNILEISRYLGNNNVLETWESGILFSSSALQEPTQLEKASQILGQTVKVNLIFV